MYIGSIQSNLQRRTSHVKRMELESLLTESTLPSTTDSSCLFYCRYESSLWVLGDGHTVLGIEPQGQFILKEDILTRKCLVFGSLHSSSISTVVANEKLNVVLSTGDDHRVVQYNLDNGQVIVNYGMVNFGYISACAVSRNLVILGGWNHKFGIIDLVSRTVFNVGVKTAVFCVYSVKVLDLDQKKLVIVLSGGFQDYAKGQTDAFEIVSKELLRIHFGSLLENNDKFV